MRTIILSCFMSVLLLTHQDPAAAQSNLVPFTAIAFQPSSSSADIPPSATISDLNCSIAKDRVILNWSITQNQTADRLIIQRSKNGKKFVMVGLVFGTDKPDTDTYQFHEKVKSKKNSYRIIMIHKDQTVEYSPVVSPETGNKKIK
jgi:hypothetical protein